MAFGNRGVIFQQIDRLYQEGTLAGLGDGQLLERYLTRRDEAAFETLVNVHGPMVLGLCRRMLRDPRDVEDAFQATFLVLVRKAPAIRDRGLLSNWLYGVAYRVATRARTNTLRRRDREITVANLEASAAPQAVDSLGLGFALDQELNRLPLKYRAPLVLCYLKGRTHDQAAAELGCPVGTVRSRLARGRDLLRRRLSSRGYAPTSAILGTGPSLPAQLFTEAVPPSLVSATVEAAIGIGSSNTIQAGAAATSALALTQGVLTTMKLAQLKWIGLPILATCLLAGGVIAVTYASAQTSGGTPAASRPAADVVDPVAATGPQATSKAPITDRTVEAEKEIERRIDQLLIDIGFFGSDGSRGGPAGDGSVAGKVLVRKLGPLLGRPSATPKSPASATVASIDPSNGIPAAAGRDVVLPRTVDPTHRSIREGVELKLAIDNYDRTEQLFKRQAISTGQLDEARGKVLLAAAMLEGLDDELSDEIDRLELEIEKKRMELLQVQAQREVPQSVVARNQRLNERKPGMVGEFVVAKAQGELGAAEAQVSVKRIEVKELVLRLEQLQRRRGRIKQATKLAERVTANGTATQLSPAGGVAPR